MKRFTLTFSLLDPTVTTLALKEELDSVLLRLHPRITYKLGRVYQESNGKLRAELAMDGKRELLDETSKAWVWKLPVRFDSLSWGWMMANEDAGLYASATSSIDVDPLAGVEPIDGASEFLVSKRRLQGRYIALMISTLGLILLFIANAIDPHSLILEGIYLVWFAIFMFSLNDTPVDIRVYAEKIGIRQQKLEVSYWMRKDPASLEWDKIWGLEYVSPVCLIYSGDDKRRFLLSERFGCKEKDVVLKTIVHRAALSYVEGNVQKLIYRKPDAGNKR